MPSASSLHSPGPTLAGERLSPRSGAFLRGAFATGWIAVAATVAVGIGLGLGGAGIDRGFTAWVYPALYLIPAGICAARAVAVRRERLAWSALALAALTWFGGWSLYTLLVRHQDPVSYPSISDWFWLAFYPLTLAGLTLLLRARLPDVRRSLWVDAAIGTLALGAVTATLLFEPILASTGGDVSAVATNLAYPLGDLMIVGFVLGVLALTGWRPGRAWLLVGLAGLIQVIADVSYLYETAAGTYAPGELIDAAWLAASMLVATAAWQRPAPAPRAPVEGWAGLAVPALFTAIALGLLTYDHFVEVNTLAFLFAVGTLVAGFARTALTFTRMRTLSSRQELLARNASILEAAGEGIYGLDAEGRTTFVNPAVSELTGYAADELVGQHHEIVHRSHADGGPSPAEESPISATLRDGIARRGADETFWRKDGTSFPVAYTASPVAHDGQVSGAVVVFRDVTEEREVQRMKDEFTGVVSHELRTPLTSIRGSLGLMAGGALGPLPEKAQRMVEIAVSNTDRLVRLINDILDIERMESGGIAMERESCDAAELAAQAAETMRPMAEEQGVALEVSAEPAALWADPDRLLQTLTNLLSNAVKFSPSGSTIRLIVTRDDREVTFAVADQGRGIPPEKLEAVFGRFEQVDASDSRDKGGTGLGLSVCRSIVQQHGGRIWAQSIPGEGARFTFVLPGAAPAEPEPAAAPDGPLILICDDDRSVREVVAGMLEERGYRVIRTADGREALEQATAQRPDAILLDLLIPGLSGWQTAAALKERPETAVIPLVILSALHPEETESPRAELADWVVKPFDEASLFRAVQSALRPEGDVSRILVVEDDADLGQVLTAMFERHGLETFHARTGREAIALSQQVLPHLIVLDLMLPEVDGFEVAAWLRHHERLRSVPLVVYTGRDLDDVERARLQLGHTEFLTKGRIGPAQFEDRVTGLLARLTHAETGEVSNGQAHLAHR